MAIVELRDQWVRKREAGGGDGMWLSLSRASQPNASKFYIWIFSCVEPDLWATELNHSMIYLVVKPYPWVISSER